MQFKIGVNAGPDRMHGRDVQEILVEEAHYARSPEKRRRGNESSLTFAVSSKKQPSRKERFFA